MKPGRLPPQPTDTALARLVRRIVDAMPWVMARNLRKARETVARQSGQISSLIHEYYMLRSDYRKLLEAGHPGVSPKLERADMAFERSEYRMEAVLRVGVSYEPRNVAMLVPAWAFRDVRISAAAAEALQMAATDLARSYVSQHRDNIIRVALAGRTIEEITKP